MIVKFLTCLAGNDFVHNVGDTAEVADEYGTRLIDAGFAADVTPKADSGTSEGTPDTVPGTPDITEKPTRRKSR